VLQGLFGQSKGQAFSQPASQTAYVVGRVDNVRAANPAVAGPLAEQVRPRLTQELVQAMVESSVSAGAQRSKAKNDPAQALSALGLSGGATPAAPAQ
jgi:peptidyl-prolyl cis-trans isomerase D